MTSSESDIAVIGAGVIGLSVAIRLREAGRTVTVFAERRTPETTSDKSGAIFSPFRMAGCAGALEWTRASYDAFAELTTTWGAETGVSFGAIREFFRERLDGDPWWAGTVREFQRLSDIPPPYADGVRAVMPKMDVRRYIPWLESRFIGELCGRIDICRVNAIDEIFARGFTTVVNSTGIGAAALANDSAVVPYRGQLLRVRNTLGLTECLIEGDASEACGVSTYVFPFGDHVVLGGTFERGETREVTDSAALAGIVKRCKALLRASGIDGVERLDAEPIAATAGLRPCRERDGQHDAVRLEREEVGDGRSIVHNYGHGRAGVTLSWGCAAAVLELVGL